MAERQALNRRKAAAQVAKRYLKTLAFGVTFMSGTLLGEEPRKAAADKEWASAANSFLSVGRVFFFGAPLRHPASEGSQIPTAQKGVEHGLCSFRNSMGNCSGLDLVSVQEPD